MRFDPDNPGKKIFLGEVNGQLVGTREDEDRHLTTVAGSRAGKGVSAIVPNLLTYRGSVLAIDPKGELACITAEHRAKRLGQRVYILDHFARLKDVPWARAYRAQYNPLTILQGAGKHGDGRAVGFYGDKGISRRAVEDAGLIVDALVVRTKGAKDPHWDVTDAIEFSAADLIENPQSERGGTGA